MCIYRWQTILIHVSPCKPLIIQDSCSWSYDKTYDIQSFVGHGNKMTLGWKCHTRAAPSCDIFNLGFVIFPCPTHYRVSSVKCRTLTVRLLRTLVAAHADDVFEERVLRRDETASCWHCCCAAVTTLESLTAPAAPSASSSLHHFISHHLLSRPAR